MKIKDLATKKLFARFVSQKEGLLGSNCTRNVFRKVTNEEERKEKNKTCTTKVLKSYFIFLHWKTFKKNMFESCLENI